MWCISRGIQQTCQFSMALGIHEACVLSTAWCHRVQAFYHAHLGGQLETPDQRAWAVNTYVEPPEFSEFMVAGPELMQRDWQRVRSLMP